MDTVTKILLVDDHDVVRKGFLSLINGDPTLNVAYEAATVLSAIEVIKLHHVDLIITDLSLPDGSGLDILNNLNELSSPPKTIVVSMYDSPPYVSESMKHGANAYLSKRTAADDILLAIHRVMNGDSFMSADIIVNLSKHVTEIKNSQLEHLTDREKEVFLLLAKGKIVKDVAKELNIMPKTAHSHRRNIFEKLSCTRSFELTQLALRHNLLTQQDLV